METDAKGSEPKQQLGLVLDVLSFPGLVNNCVNATFFAFNIHSFFIKTETLQQLLLNYKSII